MDKNGRKFQGQTITKIRSELASIYRRDLNSGEIKIEWNGDLVPPQDLEFRVIEGEKFRKNFNFKVDGKKVSGWVGVFETGKAEVAGLHLFRFDRLIEGGNYQGWKPWEIYKAPNSFMSQRLYGELNMDEWAVTHTKDAIDREGSESSLIKKLEETLADYISAAQIEKKTRKKNKLTEVKAAHLLERTAEEHESNIDLTAEMTFTETTGDTGDLLQESEIKEIFESSNSPEVTVDYQVMNLPQLKVKAVSSGEDVKDDLSLVCFPQDDLALLLVNLDHPFVQNFIGDNDESFILLSNLLFIDAVVERQMRGSPEATKAVLRKLRDKYLGKLDPES